MVFIIAEENEELFESMVSDRNLTIDEKKEDTSDFITYTISGNKEKLNDLFIELNFDEAF